MSYRKAKLRIDSAEGMVEVDGYAQDDTSWNGWSYVLMNYENARKLADKIGLMYSEETDEFMELFDANQHETFEDLLKWKGCREPWKDEKLYAIGSGYWTWSHEFVESEFNNMHNALKEFVMAARELRDNWDNEYPTVYKDRKYPEYLPSFDEFVSEMSEMVMEEDDEELKKWKETIK